jgi:hypothetical protein
VPEETAATGPKHDGAALRAGSVRGRSCAARAWGTVEVCARGYGSGTRLLHGPRDHNHVDVLPQHPERAIWAHEGPEEFQSISPDAESLRLLEERWLREAHPEGTTGGVSRWRPAPPPRPTARCLASIRRAELATTARMGRVGELLVTTRAGMRASVPRPRPTGVQGCPLRRPS